MTRPTLDLSHLLPGRKWPEANRLSALNLARPIEDRFVVFMSRDLKFFDPPKNIGGWNRQPDDEREREPWEEAARVEEQDAACFDKERC